MYGDFENEPRGVLSVLGDDGYTVWYACHSLVQ